MTGLQSRALRYGLSEREYAALEEHALPDLAACGSLALSPEEREGLELAA